MLPTIKFTSNEWATGNKMQQQYGEPNECPFCGQPEDTAHIFACNHETQKNNQLKAIASLNTQLTKKCNTTGPKWAAIITRAINELGGETDEAQTPFSHPSTTRQDDIGWINLIQGQISKTVWEAIEPNPNSTTGTTALKSLWKLASILWRCRNRKKHRKTTKERITKKGEKVDLQIEILQHALSTRHIPHQNVPTGYRYRIDSKKSWLRWHKITLNTWMKHNPTISLNPQSLSPLETITAQQSHASSTLNMNKSANKTQTRQISIPPQEGME
jgi:hypothetical protein